MTRTGRGGCKWVVLCLGCGGESVLTTGRDEERVGQRHVWEAPHVGEVNGVGEYGQEGQAEGEAVDEAEEGEGGDDEIYESCQESFCHDGVLLDDLGEVV